MNNMIESFDIFDTTLARKVLVPSDIFRLVAERIAPLSKEVQGAGVENFVAARIAAERGARWDSSEEEICLSDIWLRLIKFLEMDPQRQWEKYELECEAAYLLPIAATVNRINLARMRGGRVLYISDTYLPESFIRERLAYYGLLRDRDGLYVSSNLKKTKSAGTLFQHVLLTEQLTADKLQHYGDNIQSDIEVPRRLGIKASLCTASELTRTEYAVLRHDLSPSFAIRNVVSIARSSRIEIKDGGEDLDIEELVSVFLGPLCLLFSAWILESAQSMGIRRLYFMARDCQLIWKVAKILSSEYYGIDCRYLYASRRALLLPSVTSINEENLFWLRREYEVPSVVRLLQKLGLHWEDWALELADVGFEQPSILRDRSDWRRFLEFLQNDQMQKAVLEIAAAKRGAVTKYLLQAGMGDGGALAIVDLGWNLSCQAALHKLLSLERVCGGMRGFYLALNNNRLPLQKTGMADALYYLPPDDLRKWANPFSGCGNLASILEHVVGIADHSSVIEYRVTAGDVVHPVFSRTISEESARIAASIHSAVEKYAVCNAEAFMRDSALHNVPGAVGALIHGFIKRPTRGITRLLKDISVSVHAMGGDERPLISSLSWRDVINTLCHVQSGNRYWFEADYLATPTVVRKCYRLAKMFSQKNGKWQP